ncbi:hypothetical protein BBF96_13985 [Anoxybacter fermentans]|uniref:Sulfate exporter family transporter n=1 Tax=Anoxybacter fermentans TaxID=1323375 RepID=A0A3S9T1E7_9FIRM|nr:putative sulfate exporter family transporter [Anoxybacter fermentans]AZR74398.1 hypothetical protein BBF96_13985 [Anoxybacter fermentans]
MQGQQAQVLVVEKGYFQKYFKKIPGILLLFFVGYVAKIIAGYIPHVDYILVAITIGMVISNTVGVPEVFVPGVNTYELWLKIGIVFLGAKLALGNVLNLGAVGLTMVIVEIIVSIVTVTWLARKFGLPEKTGSLLAIGVGICGVSAIIGATGAINAKERDSSLAIATILIFGAGMIFIFPYLGHLLGLSDKAFGLWAGLAVDNTAEAVATGFVFSEAAGQIATLTKLCRNALMGIVILIFAIYYAQKGMASGVKHKGRFIWSKFPKFLLGFLLVSILVTFGFFSKGEIKAINNLAKWAFMLTFAGVGFRTRFSEMKKAGLKAFLVGLGAEFMVSIVTLVMIVLVYL